MPRRGPTGQAHRSEARHTRAGRRFGSQPRRPLAALRQTATPSRTGSIRRLFARLPPKRRPRSVISAGARTSSAQATRALPTAGPGREEQVALLAQPGRHQYRSRPTDHAVSGTAMVTMISQVCSAHAPGYSRAGATGSGWWWRPVISSKRKCTSKGRPQVAHTSSSGTCWVIAGRLCRAACPSGQPSRLAGRHL
jgi:hypothetical protein